MSGTGPGGVPGLGGSRRFAGPADPVPLPAASPATPCWRREEFVVARECGRCSGFEVVSAGGAPSPKLHPRPRSSVPDPPVPLLSARPGSLQALPAPLPSLCPPPSRPRCVPSRCPTLPPPITPPPSSPPPQKSIPECGPTGFVEKISCAASKRDEYKRCVWGRGGWSGGRDPQSSAPWGAVEALGDPGRSAAARPCWRRGSSGASWAP